MTPGGPAFAPRFVPVPASGQPMPHPGFTGLPQAGFQGFQPAAFAPPAPPPAASPLRFIPRGVDYSRVLLGRQFDRGLSRLAYPVLSPYTQRPTGHVLVVERNPRTHCIAREVGLLAQLQEMGIPVAPVHSTGSYFGIAAKLMPHMEPVDLYGDGLARSPCATRATVASLQRILFQMDACDIRIHGLQMVMNPADGSLYVSDPIGIEAGTRTDERLLGRLMPNIMGSRVAIQRNLEMLYLRFPDMRV